MTTNKSESGILLRRAHLFACLSGYPDLVLCAHFEVLGVVSNLEKEVEAFCRCYAFRFDHGGKYKDFSSYRFDRRCSGSVRGQ